jgi:NAD(P)-dependent dehydrogenase (short-subunit alcohol dehydrogenase family)
MSNIEEKIMSSFKNKVALVTGGTSGIGRATAIAFAREGAKVVVAGRREKEGNETVRQIKAAGGEALFVKTDVTKENEVKALIDKTLQTYDRLDYAFNNAGVEETPTEFSARTEEEFDKIMDANVKGVWLSMKHQIPALLKTGGAIVNNSSALGVIAMAGVAVYSASKHAVIGLTKAVALEYAKNGIRINAVLPAAIETDMFNRFAADEQTRDYVNSLHPIGRIGKSEEIADAVLWLCSDKSSFVTGHSLVLDGGFTAQ